MSNKNKSGHAQCCKGRKPPKTPGQFFALNYPSNPSGHREMDNRLHDPDPASVGYKKPQHHKSRRHWYFRLKKTAHPVFLDGSGDSVPRGKIQGFEYWKPPPPPSKPDVYTRTKDKAYRVICFNAANMKYLATSPGSTKLALCGFTWQAPTVGGSRNISGWVPLSAITFKKKPKKNKQKMLDALRSWSCCIRKYAKWGRRVASRKKPETYRLRTVAELAGFVTTMSGKSGMDPVFRRHLREEKPHWITSRLKAAVAAAGGDPEALREGLRNFGIVPRPGGGNRLTDYLPKSGGDEKVMPVGTQEYTNLCANISLGPTRPKMPPIALDILPAGHVFHKLDFKGGKKAFGWLYAIVQEDPQKTLMVGRFRWYYGYCDVVDPTKKHGKKKPPGAEKQRRYGWMPSLALKKV